MGLCENSAENLRSPRGGLKFGVFMDCVFWAFKSANHHVLTVFSRIIVGTPPVLDVLYKSQNSVNRGIRVLIFVGF